MAISFSNVTDITIPEGNVTALSINGTQVWEKAAGSNELCFTAMQANSSVKLQKRDGSAPDVSIEYSTNKTTWLPYPVSIFQSPQITLPNIGDKVYFRGENIVTSYSESYSCTFEMSGRIAASGDVTSLLNNVGGDVEIKDFGMCALFKNCIQLVTAPNLPSTTIGKQCYNSMFENCTSLATAPELPATTLKEKCYLNMFKGCTSLATAPELPSTTLATYCYNSMFENCTSLATAPELPATTLYTYCYYSMFKGCKSLTTVPELPATTLFANCYNSMFRNCTSLYVSDTQTEEAPYAWHIPESGNATGTKTQNWMFTNCLGTRATDSHDFATQKTFYTQNPPV